jgi:hypothetical protein
MRNRRIDQLAFEAKRVLLINRDTIRRPDQNVVCEYLVMVITRHGIHLQLPVGMLNCENGFRHPTPPTKDSAINNRKRMNNIVNAQNKTVDNVFIFSSFPTYSITAAFDVFPGGKLYFFGMELQPLLANPPFDLLGSISPLMGSDFLELHLFTMGCFNEKWIQFIRKLFAFLIAVHRFSFSIVLSISHRFPIL